MGIMKTNGPVHKTPAFPNQARRLKADFSGSVLDEMGGRAWCLLEQYPQGFHSQRLGRAMGCH